MKTINLTTIPKEDIVSFMYDVIYSSSSELELLEDILAELAQREDDSTKMSQLVMMGAEVSRYKNKMKNLANGVFEKKYNIVNMARNK